MYIHAGGRNLGWDGRPSGGIDLVSCFWGFNILNGLFYSHKVKNFASPFGLHSSSVELIMLTQYLGAPVEGISGKTWGTGACGIVVNDLAARLDATSARTRVHALLVLTVKILGAIRANDALGPAVGS